MKVLIYGRDLCSKIYQYFALSTTLLLINYLLIVTDKLTKHHFIYYRPVNLMKLELQATSHLVENECLGRKGLIG